MSTDLNDIIQHDGIVQEIVNDSILVRITSLSACSACHSRGACSLVEKKDKTVRVSGRYDVKQGDTVTVIMKKSMGYLAVLLSYVLPFFLVIVSLFVMNALSVPELTSGLLSIGVLLPYYLIIYLLRNRINQEFTFTLKNLNTI